MTKILVENVKNRENIISAKKKKTRKPSSIITNLQGKGNV